MAEFRDDEGRDQFGLDSRDGLGFSFNRSGVREFIRADDDGVVTHRLFIYQNGSSPNQIEYQESEIFGKDLPVLTPAWQFYGNAPEKRGLGRPAPSHVPELARGGRGGGGAGGGGGGGGAGGAGGGGGRYGRGADRGADGSPALAGGRRGGLGYRHRHRTRKNKN